MKEISDKIHLLNSHKEPKKRKSSRISKDRSISELMLKLYREKPKK